MKYIIHGKKVIYMTDEQYRAYRKHQNRESYIFGKQEWNAGVYQLEYLPFQVASEFNVEEEFERKEVVKKLWAAMAELNRTYPKYFEIVNLYFFEKYSPAEIAKHFNISRSTVDYRLKRALYLLRQILGDSLQK